MNHLALYINILAVYVCASRQEPGRERSRSNSFRRLVTQQLIVLLDYAQLGLDELFI